MSKNILGIFDSSEIEGVSALIDRLEKSSFDYLKLEGDGISITIGKNGTGEVSDVSVAPVVTAKAAAPAPAAPEVSEIPAAPKAAAKPVVSDEEGVVIIKSPSYGLFYAQPDPGAPPYVTVGAAVKVGDTIGLVEIMKTFNAITSSVAGEVVAIHVKDGDMLEPEQPLVSIISG